MYSILIKWREHVHLCISMQTTYASAWSNQKQPKLKMYANRAMINDRERRRENYCLRGRKSNRWLPVVLSSINADTGFSGLIWMILLLYFYLKASKTFFFVIIYVLFWFFVSHVFLLLSFHSFRLSLLNFGSAQTNKIKPTQIKSEIEQEVEKEWETYIFEMNVNDEIMQRYFVNWYIKDRFSKPKNRPQKNIECAQVGIRMRFTHNMYHS